MASRNTYQYPTRRAAEDRVKQLELEALDNSRILAAMATGKSLVRRVKRTWDPTFGPTGPVRIIGALSPRFGDLYVAILDDQGFLAGTGFSGRAERVRAAVRASRLPGLSDGTKAYIDALDAALVDFIGEIRGTAS